MGNGEFRPPGKPKLLNRLRNMGLEFGIGKGSRMLLWWGYPMVENVLR